MTTLTQEMTHAAKAQMQKVHRSLAEIVLGQDDVLRALLTALLADGHVLLEGVPGVGKTLLARALSQSLGLSFKRVQFTPDLMPTDLLGTRVFNDQSREWETQRGPVFTDVLLADEINRTPPKTQSALLEAMEERQVTIDGERTLLGDSFFVIATENPVEFEGTYPLPEAQSDRFLLKLTMHYPSAESEKTLLSQGPVDVASRLASLKPLLTREALKTLRAHARAVSVAPEIIEYLFALVSRTRESALFRLGASPRAGLMWLSVAKASALFDGRDFVIPEDVKNVAKPLLKHRLSLSTEAELDGMKIEDALDDLLASVPVRTRDAA